MKVTIIIPGGLNVIVEPYIPDTVDLKDGTSKPLGYHINGKLYVSAKTFNRIKDGDFEVAVLGPYTIDLIPSKYPSWADFDINVSLAGASP